MSVSTLQPREAVVLDDADVEEPSLYEVVGGQRLEIPPMSAYAGKIATRLAFEILLVTRASWLGEVVVETLFRIPLDEDRGRNRRPDVAFVSYERWPASTQQPLKDNAWDVVPDLAVEVVSPHELFEDIIDKVAEYFRAGVRLVWVVLPIQRQVYVYESPTRVQIVTDAEPDALEGGAVLPGFRLALANLFDPPQPPAA